MATDLKNIEFKDFTGGLVTNRPTSEVQMNESPDLDNILITKAGFYKRFGDVSFNGTAIGAVAVQGIAYYKPVSGTEYLVAVGNSKIYKSDALDGTMDDVTGSVTVTAGQDKIWTFAKLNDSLIAFGGSPDAPWKYTGTGNASALGGAPPTANFCFTMKDRVFAGNVSGSASTIYWSVLSNSADWTGTGSGNNAAETNDGDSLVGGIPLNNDIALLFKNHSIHWLVVQSSPFPIKPLSYGVGCCGKNAMVNINGVVYFITNEKRMKSTDGYSITNYPDSIDDLWDTLKTDRLPYVQGVYDPLNNLIHWICSTGSNTTNNYDIVWNLGEKCWLRNTTGFAGNVVTTVQGNRIFAGQYDGKCYEKYKASTYSDASVAANKINAYWRTGWNDFGNMFTVKDIKYMDIVYKVQTTGSIYYTYGYNFATDATSSSFVQTHASLTYNQTRLSNFGVGNNFQFKIYNNTATDQMYINKFGLMVGEKGVSVTNRG